MKTVSSAVSETRERLDAQATALPYGEGLAAGLIGAATVAVWFFVLDLLKGRPFYTPAILGQAIFHGDASSLQQPDAPFEVIVAFTWLPGLFSAVRLIRVGSSARPRSHRTSATASRCCDHIMLSRFVSCIIFAQPIHRPSRSRRLSAICWRWRRWACFSRRHPS